MSASQDTELLAAYGEVVMYSHLLEDILKLHLSDCARFKINGFSRSVSQVKRCDFKELIELLPRVYDAAAHPDTERTRQALHLIRRVRNYLAHAFVLQLHAELHSEEGKDQIMAMLRRVTFFARQYLDGLKQQHKKLFRHVIATDFTKLFEHDAEPLPEGRLATSNIQTLVKELDQLHRDKKI